MVEVLLHRLPLLHVEEQIRRRASLTVTDSTCSLLAPRTLAQPLHLAQCTLSHLAKACIRGIDA